MTARLGGFSGSAEFLLRVNEGKVQNIEGGTYEQVKEELYAVHATEDVLKIYFGE